ncbi:MAG: 2OG-Fe(II) oxygenase [Candidatus Binatia bacterium]
MTDPFAHLTRAAALPAADYAMLAEEFPSLGMLAAHAAALDSNQAVRMNAAQALGRTDIAATWQRFFELHTSGEYWLDVVRVFGESMRAAFPRLEARIGRRLEDWRVAHRGSDAPADVRLDCQFVMNTPVTKRSSVKTPHVDKYDKIFSALFYMRPLDDPTVGGDLALYRWRRAPRFVKHRTLPGDVEHAKTIAYAPNTYVAFVNSPASVHGVSPRDVTRVPRRYINFIAEVPVPAFEPTQASRWQRWRHGRRDDE